MGEKVVLLLVLDEMMAMVLSCSALALVGLIAAVLFFGLGFCWLWLVARAKSG